MQIVLGPIDALHNGIHGALLEAPPDGVTYEVRDGQQTLVFRDPQRSPFDALPLFEAVSFGRQVPLVHSAYWPVLDCPSWIIETGDLAYALFCSYYGVTSTFRTHEAHPGTRSPELGRDMRARAANMLRAYAHPSCKGILLYTEPEIARVRRWTQGLVDPVTADLVAAKLSVCSPAVRCIANDMLERKWRDVVRLKIIFCGRFFGFKNGAVALETFERLIERVDADVTYIGEVPDEELARRANVFRRITHHRTLPRARVQELFSGAHVLFHPSYCESLGMVLLEAAGAGMSIVSVSSPGLEHLGGWFGDGALLLNRRPQGGDDEAEAFTEMLHRLLTAPALAEKMGRANYERSATGALSISRRSRLLDDLYAACLGNPAEPLTVGASLLPGKYSVYEIPYSHLARARARQLITQSGSREAVIQLGV